MSIARIYSFFKTPKMQLTIEQRIFVVTNYLWTRIFKNVHQLFEQRFRDRASPSKVTIRKNVKKYKTEGSSLNLNKDRSGHRRTERTQENINLLQVKLMENPRRSARNNGLDIIVHLTESLNTI